ncbi:NTP transferase domain-containing protein, partial [bacterium]|nr:NTP transferase domain-containing protein [bacterium]
MNLLLLAAGKSTRIYKKIKKNKCLIKINNNTLIKHIINKCKNSLIKNIFIITGFKPHNIKKELKEIKNIRYINNDKYHSTDMVYSSILGLKKSKSDTLISYTDIFYTKKIFNIFSKSNNQFITIPYIKNWKKIWMIRNKNIFEDAETFKMDKNLYLKEIGKKINQKNLKYINGQFLGVIFIPKEYIKIVIDKYKIFNNKNLQFTQFINNLIKLKIKIRCVEYKD